MFTSKKLAVAISLVAVLSMVLGACAPAPTPTPRPFPRTPTPAPTTPEPTVPPKDLAGQTVNVMGVWGGAELDTFKAAYAPWEERTGAKVEGEFTRDLIAVLKTRVEAGNPPDIAILPNPGEMVTYAKAGKLQELNFLDMTALKKDYAQAWLDVGSYQGKLYAIAFKAANKGTVWYSPKNFAAKGYSIPTTWDELLALSDKIVADGATPWSIATESGAATGWSLTDWIAQIVLTQSGPEVYDKWVAHQIPWTDPAIKKAFQTFGQIATTSGYVLNGVDGIIATNFINGSYAIMDGTAYMYFLGDFTEGFIRDQYPEAVPGQDYAFFPWPDKGWPGSGGITGGVDVVVCFNDKPATKSFMAYLASAEPQTIWAKAGGYTSPNKSVPLDAYPNAVARTSAEMLTTATSFRVGAGDLMGGALQQEFWKQAVEFVKNPANLDAYLAALEAKAIEQMGQ
ncbi:MAG: extracellular solute-binding protein [Chloroflexi bacterium]|nr:extracellular solute-binding protein [Chloroflexota bacterium]